MIQITVTAQLSADESAFSPTIDGVPVTPERVVQVLNERLARIGLAVFAPLGDGSTVYLDVESVEYVSHSTVDSPLSTVPAE